MNPELGARPLFNLFFTPNNGFKRRWLTVFIFAAAMAWVESAVVYYLRTMVNRIQPYQVNPLPLIGGLGPAELVREAATLVMLLTVGVLAGKNLRSRLGFAAIAFGVWDILYYVFLKVMCGWPHSLTDWDILFLIPLPWWGPVWAPIAISILMIAWGTLASGWTFKGIPRRAEIQAWVANIVGMGIALYVFMVDELRVWGGGVEQIRNVLPQTFNWLLFAAALALMSMPVLHALQAVTPKKAEFEQERIKCRRPTLENA